MRLMKWFRQLQLRWKLLILIMSLSIIPLLLVAVVVANIAISLAYEGITKASNNDLEHMSEFTLDLLEGHYQQFEVYRQEKDQAIRLKLNELIAFSHDIIVNEHNEYLYGHVTLEEAKDNANEILQSASVGETGFIYVMNSKGDLKVHLTSEGENIYESQDDSGRFYIKDICRLALAAAPGKVQYSHYPWRDVVLGKESTHQKTIAFKYFKEWDWIIVVGSYLYDPYIEKQFKDRAFVELKNQIREKKVGDTGFIYATDCSGSLVLHPSLEGRSVFTWLKEDGRKLLDELCENQKGHGWLKTEWSNEPRSEPRIKIAHFEFFKPWNWVIVVETYEDELYGSATEIKAHILVSMLFLAFLVTGATGIVSFYAAKKFTFPIFAMTEELSRMKGGRLVNNLTVSSEDELGELALAFNHMSDMIRRDIELEEKLARMEKMASIGVLASGIAHEINNPMGVILGYACHLEGKLDESDPCYPFVQEIREESKRCVKIVQNLLSYARIPQLKKQPTDINVLLDQVIDFTHGHMEMANVILVKELGRDLPEIMVDRDQLRQAILNIILNAAAAMQVRGELIITTSLTRNRMLNLTFADSGHGISEKDLKDIFEPFFTTKSKGTGLGLPISKQIIDAHFGNLEVRSVEGEGTTMVISLPV
jgi:two-component system, NtrC family, sensor kinase